MATASELYDQANDLKVQGKLTEAITKLEEAATLDPDHAPTHSALAILHQRLGNNDKAIQHAIRVTELEPTEQFSYTQLSVIYQRCGRLADAEAVMFKAREMTGRPKT
jgi:Flp pilus assembly protein TadD